MVKINKLLACSAICSCLAVSAVQAAEIERNTAQMQAMDKITGRVSVVEVPVNGEVKFGSFSIIVRACKTTPPEETPENYAFVDVADSSFGKMEFNIFKGWMMSSSPALNAVEHPIYDVWLLKCHDTEVDKTKLLTAEQLKDRDGLPKLSDIKQDEDKKSPAAKDEVIPPVAEAEVLEISDTVIDENKDAEPAPANIIPSAVIEETETTTEEGGPQSLINLSTEAEVSAPASEPVKLPEAIDGTQPEIAPISAETLPVPTAEEVKPLDAPVAKSEEKIETIVVDDTAVKAESKAEPLKPLVENGDSVSVNNSAEKPAESSDILGENPADTEIFEEEDQFIDLSTEADSTAALEAELSAEALKVE